MKPRLAILSNLYPPHVLGGYEILCRQVVRALTERGWDVSVLTSDHGLQAGESRRGTVDGVPVDRDLRLFLPFGAPPKIDRAHRAKVTTENRRRTTDWLAKNKPEHVFVWSLLRATVGPARAAFDGGYRTVWTFNDANIASYAPAPWSRPHKAIADRWLYRESTLLGLPLTPSTCISEAVKDDLAQKLGYPLAAQVIHQGVPLEELPAKPFPGQAHTPFRLLYAGQLQPYKGVHDAVVAASRLTGQVSLRVAGAGDADYERRLRSEAAANVEFLGKLDREELVKQYHWADALIFPSIWREPFGLTHLEAMACGTPVISTANGGQGEFLVDEENALIVAPESPDQIEKAIRRLKGEDRLRENLAKVGMNLARTRYSLDRYMDDLEQWLLEAK